MNTMKITMLDRESGVKEEWTLDELLTNLNSDRNSDWIPYDETDWERGWALFGNPDFLIVSHTGVPSNLRNAISDAFNQLYMMLEAEESLKAEECLGFVAQAKAIWEDDEGSSCLGI